MQPVKQKIPGRRFSSLSHFYQSVQPGFITQCNKIHYRQKTGHNISSLRLKIAGVRVVEQKDNRYYNSNQKAQSQ